MSKAQHTRSAAIFASGTMISRVLGLVRDIVLTLIPTVSRDAFFLAFKFPNMLREVIGEGAVNAAFIPVLSEKLEKESLAEFRKLASKAFGAMILLLTVLTVAGVLLLPYIVGEGVDSLAPVAGEEGTAADIQHQRIDLAQWVFPYVFFIGLSVFMMAPLFTLNHYLTPSWTPALLNVSLITTCLLFRNAFADPAYALVIGVWLGGASQLIVQYIALGRIGGVWRPSFRIFDPGIRQMFWLIGPVIVGQAAGEANKLVDLMFAATLPDGTISALWYANRLIQLPLSIFGVATAVAILPSISRAGARDDNAEIHATLLFAMRQSFFLVFPAMIGLVVLREPIVSLLFGWNSMTPSEIDRTTTALLYYAFGLVAFSWIKVFVAGFYAIQNTRTPVLIASFSMLFNILLNFVLVGPLGYRGLALSTTLAFGLNAGLLFAFLCRRYGVLMNRPTFIALGKSAAATAVMAAVVFGVYAGFGRVFPGDGLVPRIVTTVIPIGFGVAVYAYMGRILGLAEFEDFAALVRRRLKR